MFLFLSSHWCSLAVPTSRQLVASWHPWLDGQYQPESPPLPAGLAFWFWGPSRCREGSWSEHIHQRQQECWSLRGPTKAWVTRDLSWPFTHAWNLDQLTGHSSRKSNDGLKSSKSANISFTSSVSWAPSVHALQLEKIKPNQIKPKQAIKRQHSNVTWCRIPSQAQVVELSLWCLNAIPCLSRYGTISSCCFELLRAHMCTEALGCNCHFLSTLMLLFCFT